MISPLRTCAAALALALLAACGSTPTERFYTLHETAARDGAALPSLDYTVVVGPVSIPDIVDRPQFVLRMSGSEVRIAEQVRWAEPLKQGIARTVAGNIAKALNNARVVPQTQSAGVDPDFRVILEVQRFDSELSQAVTLEVVWTVRRAKGGDALTGRQMLREATTDSSYQELVAAHSRAIAIASASIADAIRVSRQKDLAAAPETVIR
jgi:uncharacterized lipoprotein YmbA